MSETMDDGYEFREGIVLETHPGNLVVRMEKDMADCGGCRSCAIKALCHDRAANHIDVPVAIPDGAAPHRVGDRVRLACKDPNPAIASFILFLPTLIGLFAGGFALNLLAGEGDGIFLAGAGLGAAAGLAVTYAVGRWFRRLAPKIRLVD